MALLSRGSAKVDATSSSPPRAPDTPLARTPTPAPGPNAPTSAAPPSGGAAAQNGARSAGSGASNHPIPDHTNGAAAAPVKRPSTSSRAEPRAPATSINPPPSPAAVAAEAALEAARVVRSVIVDGAQVPSSASSSAKAAANRASANGAAAAAAALAEDEIDVAFEQLTSDAPPAPGALHEDPAIKAQHAELFRQLSVGHTRPLRDFMLELTVGGTSRQWLDIIRPAVHNVLKGATALEQPELATALAELERQLDAAARSFGAKIDGEQRAALLSIYEKLVRIAPLAFDLKSDREQREPMLVHQLLLQVPGVHKVTVDKLYAAGFASLAAYCRSSADDLMALASVERETAEGVIGRFQAYWRERTERPLHKAEEQAKGKLRVLSEQLQRAHERFQAADAREDREQKRRARGERRARCLEVNVLLAQLGELDLVAELERSSTERKIERIRMYIEQAGKSAPPGRPEAGWTR